MVAICFQIRSNWIKVGLDTGQLHCTWAGLSPSFHPNELASNDHSHFLEKLEFDREHWLKLERNSEEFHISPLCSLSIFINFEIILKS